MGAVDVLGLTTAEEEESIAANGKLEGIGTDGAIPGGPGVPRVPGIPGGIENKGAEGIHEVTWLKLGIEDTGMVEPKVESLGNETDGEIIDVDEKVPASCATAVNVFWNEQRNQNSSRIGRDLKCSPWVLT